MVRLRIDRHLVRRHTAFLPQRSRRNQADETRFRTTTDRMERATQSTTDDHVVRAGAACCLPMPDARRSSQRPKHCSRLSRMFPFWRKKRVRFSPQVVVHYETDWTEKDYRRARVGPWMHLAADRHRFQRRIREFDSKFGYIFLPTFIANICTILSCVL